MALCLVLAGPQGGALGQSVVGGGVERGVKAAFLFKFLAYVELPAPTATGAPYVVGVVGADDIADELARVAQGHSVNNRAVQVRVLHEGDTLAGIQMLFIGNGDIPHPEKLLRVAQQAGVLTVTEVDDGLQRGSVINFRLVEERVRFEVSLDAADKSKLKLSSRLLSVAYHVRKNNP